MTVVCPSQMNYCPCAKRSKETFQKKNNTRERRGSLESVAYLHYRLTKMHFYNKVWTHVAIINLLLLKTLNDEFYNSLKLK